MKKGLKRTVAFVLIFAMIAAILPLSTFANTLEITGESSGTMSGDYLVSVNGNKATILKYKGSSSIIHVPEEVFDYPVTTIAHNAFEDDRIIGIELPNSVTTIESDAFSSCSQMEYLFLPGDVRVSDISALETNDSCIYIVEEDSSADLLLTSEGSLDNRLYRYADGEVSIESGNVGDAQYTYNFLTETLYVYGSDTGNGSSDSDAHVLINSLNWPNAYLYAWDSNGNTISGEWPGDPVTETRTFDNGETGFEFRIPSGAAGVILSCSNEYSQTEEITDFSYDIYRMDGSQNEGHYRITGWNEDDSGSVTSCGSMGNYSGPWNDYGWSIRKLRILDGVTTISPYAFYGHTELSGPLPLPDSLSAIGYGAFYGCTGLNGSLTIPHKVKTIDDYAFFGCSGFSGALTLSASLTEIGGYAFEGCTGINGDLVVPNSVTSIGFSAFSGCSGISGTLTLSNSLTDIDNYAFFGCTGISGELVIPDSVEHIGDSAFFGCSGISGTLTLSDSLTDIGSYAFDGCSGITGTLIIPDSVTSLGNNVFVSCDGVTELIVGKGLEWYGVYDNSYYYSRNPFYHMNSVEKITFRGTVPPHDYNHLYPDIFSSMDSLQEIAVPSNALESYIKAYGQFLNKYLLTTEKDNDDFIIDNNGKLLWYQGEDTEVVIPDTVTVIGERAFQNKPIVSVSMGDNVTRIEDYAFSGCQSLEMPTFPESLISIGKEAFWNCRSFSGTLDLPDSITEIGEHAFEYCENITGLKLPENLTRLEACSFADCWNLEGELVIPDKVIFIGGEAFYGCESIESVIIGEGLSSFENQYYKGGGLPFSEMSSVTNITFKGIVAPREENDPDACILWGFDSLETVCVPDEAYEDYAAAFGKNLNGAKLISEKGQRDFVVDQNGTLLLYQGEDTEVVIPDGVKAIGENVFARKSAITSVAFPDSVVSIGDSAFYDCDALTSISLPSHLERIGCEAFRNCYGVKEDIVIPDSVTQLGNFAFANCGLVESVVIGSGLIRFYGGYYSIYYGSGYSPFYNMTNLKQITFRGETVPYYETEDRYENIFSGLSDLNYIFVPQSAYAAYYDAYGRFLNNHIGTRMLSKAADDFVIEDGVLTMYTGRDYDITIPDEVVAIGEGAFYHNAVIYKVTFGANVKSVSKDAFRGCSFLHEVVLNDTLEEIGEGAFAGCGQLYNIHFPDSLRVIGNEAFCYCECLSGELYLPDSLTRIGDSAFTCCRNLFGTLTLPDALTEIGDSAFSNCSGFTGELTIPDSLTVIGEGAFSYCSGLTGLTLSDGMTVIPDSAFDGCSGLAGELELPDRLTEIGRNAFYNCSSLSGELVIPDSVTVIGSGAFMRCSGLAFLTLPNAIKTIQDDTFAYCYGLEGELVIPDSVNEIRSEAFRNCSNISSIVIGKDVKVLGNSVYYYESNIDNYPFNGMRPNSICFTGNVPPFCLYEDNYTTRLFDCFSDQLSILVPEKSMKAYLEAYGGGRGRFMIDSESDFVISSDHELLTYQGNASSVTIPDGVLSIAKAAFQNNPNVEEVILNNDLQSVGAYAFKGCENLTSVYCGDDLTEIGDHAFYRCQKLSDLALGNSLESIGDYAFCESALSGTLKIPATVSVIGDYAFEGLTQLERVEIPGSGTGVMIGREAFAYCENLRELSLGKVASIGQNAFNNDTALQGELVLPDTLTELGDAAFWGCSALTGLTLSKNLTQIPDSCFSYCRGLSGEIVIPDMVTYIGRFAFTDCQNVTDLVIGRSVESIDYDAFIGMDSLRTIEFTSLSVPYVDSAIEPDSLETVYVPLESEEEYKQAFDGYFGKAVISTGSLHNPVKALKAAAIYSKSVKLTWRDHPCSEVIGYKIIRDGEIVGETAKNFYIDYDLETGHAYTYEVYGVTEESEMSAAASVKVTPAPMQFLSVKTNYENNVIAPSDGEIIISAANQQNYIDLYGHEVKGKLYYFDYQDEKILIGSSSLSIGSELRFHVDWNVSSIEAGDYRVVFEYTDPDGSLSEIADTVRVDRSMPEKIINVIAVGNYDSISLSWSQSAEADCENYRIYRRSEDEEAFQLYQRIRSRTTLTFTDEYVQKNKRYYYYVVTQNRFGTTSPPSDTAVAVRDVDQEKPVVTSVSPGNYSYISGSQEIAVEAVDNIAAVRTELYYSSNGEEWIAVEGNLNNPFRFLLNTTQINDGEVFVKAIAYDAQNNESEAKTIHYYVDNTGPEPPNELSAKNVLASKITLAWNDSASDDIDHFVLEQKTVNSEYTVVDYHITTLGYYVDNLKPQTEYTFRVAGVDCNTNKGAYSQEFTVTTLADTAAPVITALSPLASRVNNTIRFRAEAGDDCGIKAIMVQISTDLEDWSSVSAATLTTVNRTASYTCNIDISGCSDGSLFVRAVAEDFSSNVSDTSSQAPFVEYMIDKTAPSSPRGLNACGNDRWIYVSWVQGDESDLDTYSIFRSESKDEGYTLLASGLRQISYYDNAASYDKVYYYKLAVCDTVGNVSEMAGPVSAKVAQDTEPPEVLSVSPASGSAVGVQYHTVQALVKDNNCIDYVDFQMKINQEEEFRTFWTVSNINDYMTVAAADIPLDNLKDGDAVTIRVSCTDVAGLVSEYSEEYEYHTDTLSPVVNNLCTEVENGIVTLSWQDGGEEDLAGFRVYRIDSSDTETFIGSDAPSASHKYSLTDDLKYIGNGDYVYRVAVFDSVGNSCDCMSEAVSYTFTPPVQEELPPKAVINGMSEMEVGVEEYFDAYASSAVNGIVSYQWDFGDGTVSTDIRPLKKYKTIGEYTVTLTVTDTEGRTDTENLTVNIREREAIGTLVVKTIDETGSALPNVPVYFSLGTFKQKVIYSDGSGTATYNLEKGNSLVGSYVSGYLPVTKEVSVLPNAVRTITLTLVKEEIVTGRFEVRRMTFSEIQEAGIDIYDPANQNLYKVRVTLNYVGEELPIEYTRNDLKILTVTILGERSNNVWHSDPYEGETKKLGVRPDPEITYIPNDANEEIIAVLDKSITASTLKEFFDVKLHIINNAASSFVLRNNKVDLEVPDGLTVMNGLTGEWSSDTHIEFEELRGQESHTVSWVMRGDKIGQYDLTAEYSSTLSLFEAPVSTTFKTEEPIKVYGLSDFSFEIEVDRKIIANALYFNVGLKNNGSIDYYNPQLDMDGIVVNIAASASKKSEKDKFYHTDTGVIYRLLNIRHVSSDEEQEYCMYSTDDSGRIVTNLDMLSPNETIYYEYVAYNVIDYDGIAYFQRASYEVLEGTGAGVNFSIIDMDLYRSSDSERKLSELQKDGSEHNKALKYLLNNDNYISVANSDKADSIGENVYNTLDLALTLDFSSVDNRDTKKRINELLVDMMTDSSAEEQIDGLIDTQYIKAGKNMISVISNFFDTYQFYDEVHDGIFIEASTGYQIASIANDLLSNTDKLVKIGEVMKQGSGEELMESFLNAAGMSMFFTVIKMCLSEEFQFKEGSALFKGLSGVGKYGGAVIDAVLLNPINTLNDVNERQYLYTMIQYHVCKDESLLFLNSIIALYGGQKSTFSLADASVSSDVNAFLNQSGDKYKDLLCECAKDFRDQILENSYNYIDDMINTYALYTAETIGTIAIKEIIKGLAGKANVYYALMGAAFTVADKAFKIGEGFEAADTYLITSYLSQAAALGYSALESAYASESNCKFLQDSELFYGMDIGNLDESECAEYALMELKFLVRSRLLGEEAFKKFISDDNGTIFQSDEEIDKEAVDKINEKFGIAADDIEEAFDYIYSNILIARDTIFNTESGVEMIKPDAPEVSIDYLNLCTNEVFDGTYEYCLSDGEWHDCIGGKISVTPKKTTGVLRIRKKAIKGNPAGEITTVTVFSKNALSKLINARYDNGVYYFSNLSSNRRYDVCTLNSMIGDVDFSQALSVSGGSQACISGLHDSDYLAIRSQYNEELFEIWSVPLKIPVEKRQRLRVITEGNGSVSQTRADSMYFSGDDVTLTAVEDHSLFVGWYIDGQLVSKDDTYLLEMYKNAVVTARFDTGNVIPAESISISLSDKPLPTGANGTAMTGAPYGSTCYSGTEQCFDVEFTPSNTTDKTITWTSSNENVLTVDRNGIAKMKRAGDAVVTATAASGVKTTYTVHVIENSITGLYIDTPPYELSYVERGQLSPEGMSVLAQYADGSVREITDYTVSDVDMTTSGEKSITVSKDGCSDSFMIMVEHVPYWITTTDPTCHSEGVSSLMCRYCSETLDTETIPMTDHQYEWQLTKDASDSEEGVLSYKCKNCGVVSETKPISAHTHDYVTAVTQPTCTKDGYEHHECSICGYSYDVYPDAESGTHPELLAKQHRYEEEQIEATCSHIGYTKYTCTDCGDTYIENAVDRTEHSFAYRTVAPTCQHQGYDEEYCTVCGESHKSNYTDTIPHVYHTKQVEATCEHGAGLQYVCEICGDSYIEGESEKIRHEYEISVVPADCIHDGYTLYTCKNCGDSYQTDDVPATGHTFGPWMVREASDPDTRGQLYRVCIHCAEEKTQYTEKSTHIHQPGEMKIAIFPTCDTYGVNAVCCKECDEMLETEQIEALGHDMTESVIAPQCTEEGYTLHFCTRCTQSYKTDVVPAEGHHSGDWEVTKEPDCVSSGMKIRKCKICGELLQQERINAKGHSFTEMIVPPTCTKSGYTAHTCEVCGYYFADTYIKPAKYVFGDADGNGEIEVVDATFIQRYLADIPIPYSKDELLRGDVDGSGDLELIDVTVIQYYLVHMKTLYNIGETV